MRAVVQRVSKASVSVDDTIIGEIGNGLLVFLGVSQEDTEKDVQYLVDKTLNLRIFQDDHQKMNLSVKEIQGEVLVVSQFTLQGDARKGRRPSFIKAAEPSQADAWYQKYISSLKEQGVSVSSGQFAAEMAVSLVNDGPVTILLDSTRLF
jgi:D-tyrosyl-tRNA(Tyr) deacylase